MAGASGRQIELALSGARKDPRGGPRTGAGRKPRPENARLGLVKHRIRPELDRRHPVHVTLRVARGLPSFRSQTVQALLERAIDRAKKDGCQVVHYSIQGNHVHLMVEAQGKRELSSGVRRVVIAFARRFNWEVLGRRTGRIWGDRYHRRDLATPREVRNALVYLFTNAAKHGERGSSRFALDPRSSALGFDGWAGIPAKMMQTFIGTREPWRPPEARTWLLRIGWKKIHGPIVLGDSAKGARGRD